MSSSIKPPGAPSAGPISGVEPSASEIGDAAKTEAQAGHSVTEGGAAAHIESLYAQMQSGDLSVQDALETLIDAAATNAGATDPASRERIAAQLRQALADDPNLGELVQDLERDF